MVLAEISAPVQTQPLIQWVPSLFRGGKVAGLSTDHTPSSSVAVKERVELYPYFLSGASWPVLR